MIIKRELQQKYIKFVKVSVYKLDYEYSFSPERGFTCN